MIMPCALRRVSGCAALVLGVLVGGTRAAEPGAVVFNEIAWMGTAASPSDEWIELLNTTDRPVDLGGWQIVEVDAQGQESLIEPLEGTIAAAGFYLIERTDDETVSDIPADQTPTGWGRFGLSNEGEHLRLKDAAGNVVDEVDFRTGWPAGVASPDFRTMERIDPRQTGNDPDNWASNDGATRNGLDADGAPLNGTPRAPNSARPPNRVPTCPGLVELTAEEDASLLLDLPGVCADLDGDPLTVQITTPPAHGTLSADLGRYTPAPNFAGTDRLVFRASDGQALGDPVTVALTVVAAPDGDPNGDGRADVRDARVCLQLALGLSEEEARLRRCDADGDGAVTRADAETIARWDIGLEPLPGFSRFGPLLGALLLLAGLRWGPRRALVGLLGAGLLGLGGCLFGGSDGADFAIALGDAFVGLGRAGSFAVTVTGMPDGGLAALSVDLDGLRWDPSAIRITGVEGEGEFVVLAEAFDPATGRGGFALVNPLGGVTAGPIARVRFQAVGALGQVALERAGLTAGDAAGEPIVGFQVVAGRAGTRP